MAGGAVLSGVGWGGAAGVTGSAGGRRVGEVRRGRRRPEQRRKLAQLLGIGGLVLADRGGERLLVGVDELLLVAGLDGEVDPGQVRGLGAVGVRDGRRDLRLPRGGADRGRDGYERPIAVYEPQLLEQHGLRLLLS